jgi:hypothetical protein
VLHVDCLTPDIDTFVEFQGPRKQHANDDQISGSRAELSRPIGEFMFSVCVPELRVTDKWTTGDEIRAPFQSSPFHRATDTSFR